MCGHTCTPAPCLRSRFPSCRVCLKGLQSPQGRNSLHKHSFDQSRRDRMPLIRYSKVPRHGNCNLIGWQMHAHGLWSQSFRFCVPLLLSSPPLSTPYPPHPSVLLIYYTASPSGSVLHYTTTTLLSSYLIISHHFSSYLIISHHISSYLIISHHISSPL